MPVSRPASPKTHLLFSLSFNSRTFSGVKVNILSFCVGRAPSTAGAFQLRFRAGSSPLLTCQLDFDFSPRNRFRQKSSRTLQSSRVRAWPPTNSRVHLCGLQLTLWCSWRIRKLHSTRDWCYIAKMWCNAPQKSKIAPKIGAISQKYGAMHHKSLR